MNDITAAGLLFVTKRAILRATAPVEYRAYKWNLVYLNSVEAHDCSLMSLAFVSSTAAYRQLPHLHCAYKRPSPRDSCYHMLKTDTTFPQRFTLKKKLTTSMTKLHWPVRQNHSGGESSHQAEREAMSEELIRK